MSLLNDCDALGRVIGLDGERDRLVPFDPVLLKLMELRSWDLAYYDLLDDYEAILRNNARRGPAYAWVREGKPIACAGIMKYWEGVGEAWMVPSTAVSSVRHTFHRSALRAFEVIARELNLRRVSATVNTANVQADRWIRSAYFVEEGYLREFGVDGTDHRIYARLFDHGKSVRAEDSGTTRSSAGQRGRA
jgi:RimJ/RimL family protein N-acetyltransferase